MVQNSFDVVEITPAQWREMTRRDSVCARIRKPADGGMAYIEIKRAKYKHWHIIGFHTESDLAFRRSLADGTLVWYPEIIESGKLF